MQKQCTKCKETKDVSEFYKDIGKLHNVSSYCKSCKIEASLNYRNSNKQHVKELNAAWYLKNKEHVKSYQNINKAKIIKQRKAHLSNNLELYAARRSKRRARLLKACTETTCFKTIELYFKHKPTGYHLDHKVPLAKGGLHHQDNLMYVPADLNLRKGAKLLSDYPALDAEYKAKAINPNEYIAQKRV